MGEITWGTATATLAAPFVFLLPGWALLSLLLPLESFERKRRPDLGSWLALAAGLTLALTPLLLLYLDLVGLKMSTPAVLAGLAVSAIIILWRQGPSWYAWWRQTSSWRERLAWLDAPLLALVAVMVLVVGVRLWVVRGLNIGYWGDSYQHTMITQLLLDHGGLFESWAPYAQLRSFTYHFGFHGNVAFFQWATGWLTSTPTPRTLVLVGQFLNALAVLALYPLAVRLSGGKRWTGVVAVLIGGLLTPMPMYYINWGRYTQLTGQIILPVAMWLTLEAMETPRFDLRRLALAVLAVAGLATTHYFVLGFYVVFVIPYLAIWLLRHWGQWRLWRDSILRIVLLGTCSILLVLPWFYQMLSGLLPRLLVNFVQGTPSKEFIASESTFKPLARFIPHYLAVAAGAGGLWAVARKRQTAILLFWVGCQLLLSNPHWLGLPGTGIVNSFTVELSLYIPVSILAADLMVSLFDLGWQRLERARPILVAVAAILLILAAGAGIRQQKDILDPNHQLVTPADEQAMVWIRDNTPPDARFLVNSFLAYDDVLAVGSDGGWWLPLLTGRQNTIPPQSYGSETGPSADYIEQIKALTTHVQESDLEALSTVEYLQGQGISHVFVGEKGGPLLDLSSLHASPYYQAVYTPPQGAAGPWVFEVVGP